MSMNLSRVFPAATTLAWLRVVSRPERIAASCDNVSANLYRALRDGRFKPAVEDSEETEATESLRKESAEEGRAGPGGGDMNLLPIYGDDPWSVRVA